MQKFLLSNDIQTNSPQILDEYNKQFFVESVIPFCDGVILYQDSEKYPEWFGLPKVAIRQGKMVNKIAPLIMSQQLIARKGDKIIKKFSDVYEEPRKLSQLFESFQQKLAGNPELQSPLVFIIHSTWHTLTVSYEPTNKQWSLVDIDYLPITSFDSPKEMAANWVFEIFSDGEPAILAMHLYCTGDTASATQECLANWPKRSKVTAALAKKKDLFGCNWLMLAACEGELDTVKQLVEKGADITNGDQPFYFPITTAIDAHQNAVAEYLIKKCVDIMLPVKSGPKFSILDAAVRSHNFAIFNFILDKKLDSSSNEYPLILSQSLFHAAGIGNSEAISQLLAKGIDPNPADCFDFAWGYMLPAFPHANKKLKQAQQQLLKNKKLIGEMIGTITPLHIAVFCGQIDCVKTLLKAGADPQGTKAQKITPAELSTTPEITTLLQRYSKNATSVAKSLPLFQPQPRKPVCQQKPTTSRLQYNGGGK